jgi:phage terminase small subunit
MAKKSDELCIAFAREYHVDRNGTRAARAAGLAGDENVLAITASRLLKDPRVKRELARARRERAKRTGVSADQVVRELARLGFSDIRDICEWDEGGNLRIKASDKIPRKIARAIKEITERVTEAGTVITTVKLHDKVKPLELLGRHTGALTEKPDANAEENSERVVVHLPDNGRDRKDD